MQFSKTKSLYAKEMKNDTAQIQIQMQQKSANQQDENNCNKCGIFITVLCTHSFSSWIVRAVQK